MVCLEFACLRVFDLTASCWRAWRGRCSHCSIVPFQRNICTKKESHLVAKGELLRVHKVPGVVHRWSKEGCRLRMSLRGIDARKRKRTVDSRIGGDWPGC